MDRSRTPRTTTRGAEVAVPVDDAWTAVAGTAGSPWFVDAVPFVVRGGLDRLVGGAGRRWPAPSHPLLRAGDCAGFWRVVEASPPSASPGRLVLEADVRAPGTVRLTTTVVSRGPARSRVEQTTLLEPDGLLGWTYLVVDLGAREVVSELSFRRLLSGVA